MKKCSYCGHPNSDDAPNCEDCGEELEQPEEPAKNMSFPQANVQVPDNGFTQPYIPASTEAGLKSVAYLEAAGAVELAEYLRKASIPFQMRSVMEEGELEFNDILVEENDFERACDIAEVWMADRAETNAWRSNRHCPKCGSCHLDSLPHEKLGYIMHCRDCGEDFAY